MGKAINPFEDNRCDLGVEDAGGYSLAQVGRMLQDSYLDQDIHCMCCGNTPDYRLLAKHAKYDSVALQNGVYICENCLSHSGIDKKQYKLKQLRK